MSVRSTYHHGNLRPALIAAARALLDSGGLGAVGLRETARNVGVSATATYRVFLDKESLLAAVATQGFGEFGRALGESMKDGAPFSAMGRAYVHFAVAHPGLFRLMFSPIMREQAKFPDLVAAAEAAFAGLRAGANGSRHAAAGASYPDAAAYSAWSLVHGLAHLYLDGVISLEKLTELVDALLPARATAA